MTWNLRFWPCEPHYPLFTLHEHCCRFVVTSRYTADSQPDELIGMRGGGPKMAKRDTVLPKSALCGGDCFLRCTACVLLCSSCQVGVLLPHSISSIHPSRSFFTQLVDYHRRCLVLSTELALLEASALLEAHLAINSATHSMTALHPSSAARLPVSDTLSHCLHINAMHMRVGHEPPHVLYFNSLSFLAVPQWFGWFIVCGRWHRIGSIVSEQFLMIALLSLMQDWALLSLSSSPSSFTSITSECMCGLGRSWQHHHLSLSRRLLTIAIISFPC